MLPVTFSKRPLFRANVVSPMARLNMFVVGSAFEHHVAVGSGVARVGVISDFIGVQDVNPIVNLSFTVQLIYGADFFLACGWRLL